MEVAFEIQRVVADVGGVEDAAPFHIERDLRALREASRKDPGERTSQIVIVRHGPGKPEGSLPGVKVHLHAVVGNRDRPKQTIRADVGVVVMNLVSPNWTIEEVQSDEAK